jgi:hypothetical protein
MGCQRLVQRHGAIEAGLQQSRWDFVLGMLFSNAVMYFIILSYGCDSLESGQD